jgi:hypothetical protein
MTDLRARWAGARFRVPDVAFAYPVDAITALIDANDSDVHAFDFRV